MWGMIHSPTASKYRARSNFVTARVSPEAGQKTLSGLEIATPMMAPGRSGCR